MQQAITDTTITYIPTKQPRPSRSPHTRRARLFPGRAGTPVCVVTQTPDDDGVVSITNAAEAVLAAVRDHPELGGKGTCLVIEHYDKTNYGGETFALVSQIVTQHEPVWEHLTRADLDRDWPGLADQL